MFYYLIVVLAVTGAAFGSHSECMHRASTECKELPEDYPTMPEDLRRDCIDIKETVKCVKDIFESCPEAEKEAREVNLISGYLEDTCDENSNTYEVLSRHISCAGPILNDIQSVCPPLTMTEEEEKVLAPILTEENIDLLTCGFVIRQIMCSSVAISKRCGEEMKYVMADLQMKYNLHYSRECTPDILRRIEPYLDDYENVLMKMEF